MNTELIISVIVPVYNAERFIRRAVESVLCQMDGRIELILVDDGSTDTSGTICDEYASENTHIHVIHKDNGGTSSAKNRGIEIAKGRYISFMDSDDFLEPDTLEQIIPVLLEHQPDCLDFGLNYVNMQGEISENVHQCRKNILLPLLEIETVILPPLLNLCKDEDHFIFDFCCNKVFNSEIIKSNRIRFDENKQTWEDRTFLLRHLKHCQNYYAMDKCFYNYVYTPNSLSQRYCLSYFDIILANFNHYRELYEDRFDFDTQYANNYWSHAIENMVYRSLEQKENLNVIRNNILQTLQNEQVRKWFTKRARVNSFDKKISELIAKGNAVEALHCYEKKVIQRKRNSAFSKLVNCIKYGLMKICRGKQ